MAHRLYPKVLVYFWVDERVLDQLPDLLQYPQDSSEVAVPARDKWPGNPHGGISFTSC